MILPKRHFAPLPGWIALLVLLSGSPLGQTKPGAVDEHAVANLLASGLNATHLRELTRELAACGTRAPGTPSAAKALGVLERRLGEAGLITQRLRGVARHGFEVMKVTCEVIAADQSVVLASAWPLRGSLPVTGSGPVRAWSGQGEPPKNLAGAWVFLDGGDPATNRAEAFQALLRAGACGAFVAPAPAPGRDPAGAPLAGPGDRAPLPVLLLGTSDATRVRELLFLGEPISARVDLQCRVHEGPTEHLVATIPGRSSKECVVLQASLTGRFGGVAAGESAAGVAVVSELARTLWITQRFRERGPFPWDVMLVVLGHPDDVVGGSWTPEAKIRCVLGTDAVTAGPNKDAVYLRGLGFSPAGAAAVREAMASCAGRPGFFAQWCYSEAAEPAKMPGQSALFVSSVSSEAWRVRGRDLLGPPSIGDDESPTVWTSADRSERVVDVEPQNLSSCARGIAVILVRLAQDAQRAQDPKAKAVGKEPD